MAGNGWEEYQKLVLAELERLNSNYEKLDEKVDGLTINNAKLNVKSSTWGAIGSMIPISIIGLCMYIKSKLGS